MGRTILCVLAGGNSERFGRDKTEVLINGEAVLVWLSGRVRGTGLFDEAWVSVACEDRRISMESYDRVVRDSEADAGPLSGIGRAVEVADESDVIAFIAGDGWGISTDVLARLLAANDREAGVVMGRWADGRVEPLPGVWRVGAARRVLREGVDDGVRGPSGLAGRDGVVCLDLRERDRANYDNANTPEDADRIAARLGVRWS